jgi:hypothetical protein
MIRKRSLSTHAGRGFPAMVFREKTTLHMKPILLRTE